MPTRGRQGLASLAVESFLSQDYAEKELVTLDDADCLSFPGGIDHPLIRYHVAEKRMNIPDKRNRCCELATGEIIMHWDSDDFSDPRRMSDQVEKLAASGKSVIGYRAMPFLAKETGAWYTYDVGASACMGTSLTFFRSWWKSHPFRFKPNQCEDNLFYREAGDNRQLAAFPDSGLMAALAHHDNTSKKNLTGGYRRLSQPPDNPRMQQWASRAAQAR